jgi:hypothetical protein
LYGRIPPILFFFNDIKREDLHLISNGSKMPTDLSTPRLRSADRRMIPIYDMQDLHPVNS